jgi:hypothetical protein
MRRIGHNTTRTVALSRPQKAQLSTLKRPQSLIYNLIRLFLIGRQPRQISSWATRRRGLNKPNNRIARKMLLRQRDDRLRQDRLAGLRHRGAYTPVLRPQRLATSNQQRATPSKSPDPEDEKELALESTSTPTADGSGSQHPLQRSEASCLSKRWNSEPRTSPDSV